MMMVADLARDADHVEFKAIASAGIEREVATAAASEIVRKLNLCADKPTVQIIRFLPTTRSSLSENRYEVLANVYVEIGERNPKFNFPRSQMIQAVISFDDDGVSQKFVKASILHD